METSASSEARSAPQFYPTRSRHALAERHSALADGRCDGSLPITSGNDAIANIQNPFYIGDQPGGTQVSGWFDAWAPAPSAYAVKAQSSGDVAAAVNFARENNLRLVAKGAGHSYQGTSNAPDSLLIWTRAVNKVTLHDAFTPRGGEGKALPSPAVTAGAGSMWIDLCHGCDAPLPHARGGSS